MTRHAGNAGNARDTITIQDRVYYRDSLTDNDEIMLKNISYIQEEIDRIQKTKVIAQMARDSVIDKLLVSLENAEEILTELPEEVQTALKEEAGEEQ